MKDFHEQFTAFLTKGIEGYTELMEETWKTDDEHMHSVYHGMQMAYTEILHKFIAIYFNTVKNDVNKEDK